MAYTDEQVSILVGLEILGACLSFLLCSFVILTYIVFKQFQKAANGILFYAAVNNLIYTISGFINLKGVQRGSESSLCQLQAFIIQATLPADTLWNFAVALNVYLAVLKLRPNIGEDLKGRELKYLAICCATPYILSLILLCVRGPDGSHIYGDADMWCWITSEWTWIRVFANYGISWFCTIANFTMYTWIGFKSWKLGKEADNLTYHGTSPERQRYSTISNAPLPKRVRKYITTCVLFFISSLITWVPSSVNRIWTMAYPDQTAPFILPCIAALVLQLTGFWNSLVYIMVSKKEIREVLNLDASTKLMRWPRSRSDRDIGTDIEALPLSSIVTNKHDNSNAGIRRTTTIEQSITMPEPIHEA